MHQEIIAVSTSDGPMAIHCYLPSKQAKTPLPAVILLQEAFGVNAHIKRYCERITNLDTLYLPQSYFIETDKESNLGILNFRRYFLY